MNKKKNKKKENFKKLQKLQINKLNKQYIGKNKQMPTVTLWELPKNLEIQPMLPPGDEPSAQKQPQNF